MSLSTKKESVAFLVAHPDDVAHSMGGTAWMLRSYYELNVLCLTKGERGIKGKSIMEAAAIREDEETLACRLLNANLTFLGQIDADTFADREICNRVAEIIKRLKPIALFTLWPINEHPDHTTAHNIAMKALRLAGAYHQTEIYFSENTIGAETNQFAPDIYVDISSVIEMKRQLVRCHKSQNPNKQKVEFVLQRNVLRGMIAGCRYAEGFKTLYPIMVNATRPSNAILASL